MLMLMYTDVLQTHQVQLHYMFEYNAYLSL